ncbi:hypothetical protein MTR67_040191 [Solanum verrucosum]|uniref:Integrase catalytic domain-containing protein n=1 Tax=Solanum verrucosum TaxID=315347 RepID=A0AAF0UJQ0_SOLVR|nr:hypothetical protein MTR67_040191 [Solanum verrucosum]
MKVRDDQYGFYYWFTTVSRQHDSIWVIVDRMTKSTHFLQAKTTFSVEDYAKLYIQEVVRLHGVLVSIFLDKVAQFTTQFWKSFQKCLTIVVSKLYLGDSM